MSVGGFRIPQTETRSPRAERRREGRAEFREKRKVLHEMVTLHPVSRRNAVRRVGGILPKRADGNLVRLTRWGKNHVERGPGGRRTLCGLRIDPSNARTPDPSVGMCVSCGKIVDAVAEAKEDGQ